MLLTLSLSLLVSSPVSSGSSSSTTAPVSEVTVFRDGGALREVERSADGRVRYRDVVTGRSTVVGLDTSMLLQLRRTAVLDDVMTRHGLQLVRPAMPSIGVYVVRATDGHIDGAALAARVQARHDDDVLEAFPNLAFTHTVHGAAADEGVTIPPDDPRYAAQWFYDDIGMPEAWALAVGDAGVVVSVVDNGCDLVQPDLVSQLLPGDDVIADDEDPSYVPDSSGNEHGTACAGLVAASTDNGLDVAGTCPLCKVRCTRLLGGDGEGIPLDADVRAFEHALADDVAVVSNSWGFTDAIPVPTLLKQAIQQVQQFGRGGKGAVVVFASGNDSREVADDELLAVPGILGVGAVNNLGELTQFSNRGRSVDVVAPTGTTSTDISGADGGSDGDVTFQFGGTSSAAPIVAGIAGLVVSAAPELTADEVNTLLEQTAQQSPFARPGADGHDLEYGFGVVRPAEALAALGLPEDDGDDEAPAPDSVEGCDCRSTSSDGILPLLGLLLLRRRKQR
jgi:serine protease